MYNDDHVLQVAWFIFIISTIIDFVYLCIVSDGSNAERAWLFCCLPRFCLCTMAPKQSATKDTGGRGKEGKPLAMARRLFGEGKTTSEIRAALLAKGTSKSRACQLLKEITNKAEHPGPKANHVEDLADDSIEPEDYVQDLKKLAQYTDSVFPPSMPKDAIKRSRARQKALKKADLIADGPKVCK